jgi:hypothetical protein
MTLARSAAAVILLASTSVFAATRDLGRGFADHGVAVPISNHRGTVATVDGNGRNVLLQLLMDHRGGYEVLLLDAATGKAEQFPIPFKNPKADSPFASLLSSANRFYAHFGDHFVEFDPARRAFTFFSKTTPQMSMGMTEDDHGVIWSVSYPNSGVVSYDPKAKKFTDYGSVYKQNWPQYQRYVAADDTGIVYFAVGNTASQIVAFDPKTRQATPLVPDGERKTGTAYVFRATDGKVYGQALKGEKEPWLELYQGKATKLSAAPKPPAKKIVTGSQTLNETTFPDGSRVQSCDLVRRKLVVAAPGKDKKTQEFSFDYDSEGAIVMGTALASDGTIVGGTAFPMRFYSYDPKTDKMIDRPAYGQWNAITPTKDRLFIAAYPTGSLMEWDPGKPWENTDARKKDTNPRLLESQVQDIHRPHCILALDDGNTVVFGGTPEYGYTGGGLSIWDRKAGKSTLLKHTDLVRDLATYSIAEIPGEKKLLAGMTTQPGTGGERKAKEAEMYLLDLGTKKIDWHAPVFPGAQEYTALHRSPRGEFYGIVDGKTFFVFDVAARKVTYQQDLTGSPPEPPLGVTAHEQAPRIFVDTPEGDTYLLLKKGIAKIDGKSHKVTLVATSPEEIEAGVAYLDGRIYYVSTSHLCSYDLKTNSGKGEISKRTEAPSSK